MGRRIIFAAIFFLVSTLLGSLMVGRVGAAIYCACSECTCCTGNNCVSEALACWTEPREVNCVWDYSGVYPVKTCDTINVNVCDPRPGGGIGVAAV